VGIGYARMRISNLADPELGFEDDFPIDTGSLYSFAPRQQLLGIGVAPTGTKTLRLADGSQVQREIGDVFFEIGGERRAAPVIFGGSTDERILGVLSLEALALKVNPVTRALEPMVVLAVGNVPVG
jgi:predicted aspartyl protease